MLRTAERELPTRQFETAQDGVNPVIDSIAPDTSTRKDLKEISMLQARFDHTLGRSYDREDTLVRSYNPVIDRWRIEKLRSAKDEEGEESYIREIRVNLKTNMKERLQVGDNVVRYLIIGDQLYSEQFPNEPFGKVLERGAEYRLLHGTPEPEREGLDGERGGFEKIRSIMTDPQTPAGTKVTSFSPRGRVENTSYDRNIVDEYELVEDSGERYVQMTRRMVDFDEADYLSSALSLDPKYFDNYDGRPLDAWMLARPVVGFLPDLPERQQGISSETFERIYEDSTLQNLIDYYIERIEDQEADWREIALAFNAILNQVDTQEKKILSPGKGFEKDVYLSAKSLKETVRILGYMNPRERGGAGCPTNKGYGLTSNSSYYFLAGSVAAFAGAGGGSGEDYSFNEIGICVKCSSGPRALGPCKICISCDASLGGKAARTR